MGLDSGRPARVLPFPATTRTVTLGPEGAVEHPGLMTVALVGVVVRAERLVGPALATPVALVVAVALVVSARFRKQKSKPSSRPG